MLAVSPLIRDTSSIDERDGGGMESFSIGGDDDCFPDFSGENLLDSIDFDDLFLGMDEEGDHVLPDLEMDPEMLAEFSSSGGEEYPDIMNNTSFSGVEQVERNSRKDQLEEDKVSSSDSSLNQGEELVSKRSDELSVALKPNDAIHKHKGRKSSSAHSKNPHGKRKVKVDWTPELHRRFVQAVEQLGVDKAVPSRILELMGFDCLTRHNIASHLQKYRSHRKHLQAREAEAVGWSTQRRRPQHGAPPAAGGGGGGGGESKLGNTTTPWRAPTMGFPPSPMTPPPRSLHPHFRPLHVWGHPSPTVDKSFRHMWPKHLLPPPPYPPMHPLPAAVWAQAPRPPPQPRPPPDHSFWHSHQRVPNSVTPGTPCFPPPLAATLRFPSPPVPGIPPHTMYRVDPGIGVPATRQTTGPHHPSSIYPSMECVDAAIGDVLSKPCQPLPLGLKPPSLDGVMVELQRQGVPNIPPPPTWA